jgi:hypothetical protein
VHSHRVLVDLELFSTDRGGLDFDVQERNRSLLFVFSPPEEEPLQHGAVIEQLFGQARPGARVTAQVRFFDDSAAIVASAGAAFDLWLGRTVGRGVVKKVLAEW